METERDKSLAEYCGYLRAEAAMVDSEEGTDCTTRACLLRGAADEIERQREHIKMDADLYIKSLNTIVDLEQRLAAAEAALKYVDDAIAYWGVERGQVTLERIETALNKYEAGKKGEMIPNESDMLNANIRIHELERERDELRERLAAAEADARRWRYVRDNSTIAGETQEGVYLWEWEALDRNADSIDADVDASIEAAKRGRDE